MTAEEYARKPAKLMWKIWYGSIVTKAEAALLTPVYRDDVLIAHTFDNLQGRPQDAPGFGVVTIGHRNEKYNLSCIHHHEFYYYHEENRRWWGSNLFGALDQFCNFPDMVHSLKVGRLVDDREFDAILLAARTDPDFPAPSPALDRNSHPDR